MSRRADPSNFAQRCGFNRVPAHALGARRGREISFNVMEGWESMKNRILRVGSVSVLAMMLGALLAFAGQAGAKGNKHKACHASAGSQIPVITLPCTGAVIKVGSKPTFKVYDANIYAHKYKGFINLNKQPPRQGIVPNDSGADGFYDTLKPVKGHRTQWFDRPTYQSYAGYWSVTPGKYYVQVQQVDLRSKRNVTTYSPVSVIIVR